MNDSSRLLAALMAAPPFIPELHKNDCDNPACIRCEPEPAAANPIERLDVTAAQLEAEAILRTALAATHSPSDAIAYQLDLYLVTHPDAPVSTDADYPGWTPGRPS